MRAVLPAPLSVVDKISEYRIPKDLMEPRRSMYMKKQAEIQKGVFTTYNSHSPILLMDITTIQQHPNHSNGK